jgi:hypothetical protein
MALLPNGDYPPPLCQCPEVGVPCPACQAEKGTRTRSAIQRHGAQQRWAAFRAPDAVRARLAAYQEALAALQPVPPAHPQGQRIRELRQNIKAAEHRVRVAVARLAAFQGELAAFGEVPPPRILTGHHPHAKAIRKLRRQIRTEELRLSGWIRPMRKRPPKKRHARKRLTDSARSADGSVTPP